MSADLSSIARRGASFTVALQVLVLVITFGGTFVLANLLPPAAFGLIAIVAAATGAGDLLRDAGLANAAIQARQLSEQQRSNLFWVSSSLGFVVSLVVFAAAPLLGAGFGDGSLTWIAQATAMVFVLNGLASQHRASISRELRLRTAAIIDASASIAATTTAILIAALTHSVWALVFQQLAGPAVALVLAFMLARWVPKLPRKSEGIKPMLTYGFHQLGAQLAVYAGENVDTLVAGARFSSSDVGLYSRSYSLVTRPLTQINVPSGKLANPVLSRLQDDDVGYYFYLLKAQRLLLLVTAAAILLFASVITPLVSLLLGSRWLPMAPIIQILAVGALFRVAAFSTSWLAASRGLNRISLLANLCGLPITVIAVILGSNLGIQGIAVGQTVSAASLWILGLIWFTKRAGAPGGRLFRSALLSLLPFICPFFAGFFVSGISGELGALASLALGALSFVICLTLEVILLKPLRTDFNFVLQVLVVRSGRV